MMRMKGLCCLLAACALTAQAGTQHPPPEASDVDKSVFHLFNPTPEKYLRELTLDGPGSTESPYTVDAGHFQVEMLFASYTTYHEKFTDPDFPDENGMYLYERWSVAPMILKLGLLNKLDVQLVLEPYNFVYEREFIGEDYDLRSRRTGYGDTLLRFKYNIWGNDGGRTALAVTPYVKFPTSQNQIGNNGVEEGIVVPFEMALLDDLYVSVTTRFDWLRDVFSSNYHAEFGNSLALSYDILENFGAYAEFFSVVSREQEIRWMGGVGMGLTFWLTDDLQLYLGAKFGLTRSTDEFSPYVGMAWRF